MKQTSLAQLNVSRSETQLPLRYFIKTQQENKSEMSAYIEAREDMEGKTGKIISPVIFKKEGVTKIIISPKTDLPIHKAIISRDKENLRVLLLQDENVNRKDNAGYTPLHVAVLVQNIDMIKMLREHGANPEIKDASGETCLDYLKHMDEEAKSLIKPLLEKKLERNSVKNSHIFFKENTKMLMQDQVARNMPY